MGGRAARTRIGGRAGLQEERVRSPGAEARCPGWRALPGPAGRWVRRPEPRPLPCPSRARAAARTLKIFRERVRSFLSERPGLRCPTQLCPSATVPLFWGGAAVSRPLPRTWETSALPQLFGRKLALKGPIFYTKCGGRLDI